MLREGGQEVPTTWRDLMVGDVVKVLQDQVGGWHTGLPGVKLAGICIFALHISQSLLFSFTAAPQPHTLCLMH